MKFSYKYIVIYLLFLLYPPVTISQINSISGLVLWLTGDSVQLSSGNQINRCYDLSSSGNDAIQIASSKQPSSIVSSLNGHKSILLDGIDDYFTFTEIPDIRSVFFVIKENASSVPNYRPLLGHTSLNDFHRGTTKELWSTGNTSNSVINGINRINSVPINGLTTNAPTEFSIISLVTTGNVKADNFSNDRINFGRLWDGSLLELIIYNQALTTVQVDSVENYLHQKYAPPLSLSDDISTCSLPITLHAKKDYFTNYLWMGGSSADSLIINSPGTYYLTVTDIFNKVSSDTINVFLSPPTYSVTLGNDTTICSGQQIVLNAGPENLTYLWSNSSTSHSINVYSQATYSVSVTDCSGNISIDSIKVIIQNSPTFNFGANDTIICNNSGFILDPGFASSSGLTFHWQDNLSTQTHSVTSNGQYYLDVTDNIGCKSSDTINIQIDNSLNSVSLGPDIALCAGNLITLTSGATQPLTYVWNNSSINDSLLVNSTGQYSVVVTNTNSCSTSDTINITILGQAPSANFITNIGCQNKLVTFTNLSIPPVGNTIDTTIWSFGEPLSSSNTSTLVSPSHTYTNTGTYTVSLKVITDAGCTQSIIKQIIVSPVPTATFAFGTSCQNDSTAFSSQSTGTTGYPIVSTNWNFGDISNNTSNLITPKHVFSNFMSYTVTLIVTNSAGCKDSIPKQVNVNAEVKANFTNGPACLNNPTLFQSTSIIPPTGTPAYSWTIASSYPNTMAPVKTFTNSGVYPVTLFVDGNNGCTSSITKLINVYLPPVANFSIPSFCSKDTITAINLSLPQSGIMSSYNWRLNTTSFSTIQSPTLFLIPAGTYSVRLTVANSFGCKDSTTKSFTVYPLPLVDFTTNPAAFYYLNEPVNFIPSITNASSYLWNITSAPTSTLQSPTETFNSEGSYTVSLNLKDQLGCRNSKIKTISVSKRHLDLAILNVTTLKDNDGFMTVVADLANYGSVPISSFKIDYQISDGGNIKETWNGTLNPNSFYVYTFNATSASVQNSVNNITCVELEKINGAMDDNTINNAMCNTLNTSDISVSNPIPNPTNGDIVLPITLNRDLDYTIAIYNSIGQIQYDETTQKGLEGLNFVTLPTSSYARGCYIIKIMIDGKVFIKKFIEISPE